VAIHKLDAGHDSHLWIATPSYVGLAMTHAERPNFRPAVGTQVRLPKQIMLLAEALRNELIAWCGSFVGATWATTLGLGTTVRIFALFRE